MTKATEHGDVQANQLWNKLPEEVVSASNVSAFISRLN